jgi:hypothetical protein
MTAQMKWRNITVENVVKFLLVLNGWYRKWLTKGWWNVLDQISSYETVIMGKNCSAYIMDKWQWSVNWKLVMVDTYSIGNLEVWTYSHVTVHCRILKKI